MDRGGKEQTEQSRKESWKVGEGGVEGEEGGRENDDDDDDDDNNNNDNDNNKSSGK